MTGGHQVIAKKGYGHQTSFPKLKLPESKRLLLGGGVVLLLLFALAYYFLMPVAEVATVRRGTAIAAVYGTVRIEPAFVVRVRAQNDGFLRLAEAFSAGRGAIGSSVEKGQLLATIADEETSRELKQARADLKEQLKITCSDSRRLSPRAMCPQSNIRRRRAKRIACVAQ